MPPTSSSVSSRVIAALASSPSKSRRRSSSTTFPFIAGLVLGAGVATLLHIFLAIGSSGGSYRAAGGKSQPFSFMAPRSMVAVSAA